MRVLQVMAGAQHGGAETFFERLVPALARAGLDQHVIIRRDPERTGRLRRAGVAPLELAFGGALDFLTPLLLGREIKRYNPNVVISWMNRATLKTPRGSFVHVARLGGYYDLKYYRDCDHLIGNTPDIVDYLVDKGWPAERAHYLPNFPDERIGTPIDRAEIATPNEAPLLLALGRLHENKGFDVLIRAMAHVPDAVLWIAGEGPLRSELRALAESEGVAERVRFLGWREDTGDLLATADLLICPSRHEPLGNVVLEGWVQGRPVVAAAAAGPSHLIEDGRTGLLVPIENADALGQVIQGLLADPQRQAELTSAGREAFANHYSEAHVVQLYLDFLDRVTAPVA